MGQILSYCIEGSFDYDKVSKIVENNADGKSELKVRRDMLVGLVMGIGFNWLYLTSFFVFLIGLAMADA